MSAPECRFSPEDKDWYINAGIKRDVPIILDVVSTMQINFSIAFKIKALLINVHSIAFLGKEVMVNTAMKRGDIVPFHSVCKVSGSLLLGHKTKGNQYQRYDNQ